MTAAIIHYGEIVFFAGVLIVVGFFVLQCLAYLLFGWEL